jgi:hypothetical protein
VTEHGCGVHVAVKLGAVVGLPIGGVVFTLSGAVGERAVSGGVAAGFTSEYETVCAPSATPVAVNVCGLAGVAHGLATPPFSAVLSSHNLQAVGVPVVSGMLVTTIVTSAANAGKANKQRTASNVRRIKCTPRN